MRQALNENPKVQAAVVGVLILVVGFMLVTRVMGGGSSSEAPPAPTAAGAAPGATTGVPAAATTPGDPAATAAPAGAAAPAAAPTAAGSVPTSSGSVSPEALEPGPGFPAPVAAAWSRGDAIVLLIVKNGGTDDQLVRASVPAVSRPGVAVFVTTAGKIARYSRITQGVGVSQVPALVVVRPKGISKVPEATVSYGFRNPQSVIQAVNDALYRGPDDLPYNPG
jgi:hypothetical protein